MAGFVSQRVETDALLAMVILFSPDKLMGKVFFPDEDCGGRTNQFFELSSVSHMLAVTDNILIGGERKRVAKVMLFKMSWLENNYLTPLRSFEGRLQRMIQALHCRRGEKVEKLTHNHQRDLFKKDEMENLPLTAGTESASFSDN
ncbi:hypothetical protein P5673_024706 [Acropora cervicornis]|uniref:Uncharacterized protein n=1 Tax=Acropora cervicornis TaxID=6130 RepID=A0AAD9UXY9_ACRCE|nr:hypothetical protein P5673_024706 [Acropora cervicornis]